MSDGATLAPAAGVCQATEALAIHAPYPPCHRPSRALSLEHLLDSHARKFDIADAGHLLRSLVFFPEYAQLPRRAA